MVLLVDQNSKQNKKCINDVSDVDHLGAFMLNMN